MSLKFCSLSSGSSGNSYLVYSSDTGLLVDAGITGKALMEGLTLAGLSPEEVSAILVTHEHHDHIKGLPVIQKKVGDSRVYASPDTLFAISTRLEDKVDLTGAVPVEVSAGSFDIGDIRVRPFYLSHDATLPISYTFSCQGKRVGIVTDTGVVTDEIFDAIVDSDLLVLEANHEENVLLMGKYPYNLKSRILGDYGHLSNEAAADCIVRMLRERNNINVPTIALAHLSGENNTPDLAYVTITNILYESNYIEGKDYYIKVLMRDKVGEIIEL